MSACEGDATEQGGAGTKRRWFSLPEAAACLSTVTGSRFFRATRRSIELLEQGYGQRVEVRSDGAPEILRFWESRGDDGMGGDVR